MPGCRTVHGRAPALRSSPSRRLVRRRPWNPTCSAEDTQGDTADGRTERVRRSDSMLSFTREVRMSDLFYPAASFH